MSSRIPSLTSRVAGVLASLAVTVVMAVVMIIVLALGSAQDSKAEPSDASPLTGITTVEDPAVEWGGTAAGLPERSAVVERPMVVSRDPLASLSPESGYSVVKSTPGPTQEWLGMSKLAIPLLVSDLVGGRPVRVPTVMTGQAVGVVR